MKITDALLGEHGLFYVYFERLNDRRRDAGADAHAGLLAMLDDLLVSHARLEEDLLFPALDPHLGEMGPLAVMRHEHTEIENLFAAARAAETPDRAEPLIADLLGLVRNHFAKEEAALFHLAEQCLDDEALHDLGDKWAEARGVNLAASGCAA